MKITNKRDNLTSFESLNEGDVFFYDSVVYMKTECVETPYADMCNAIVLKSGTFTYFFAKEMVCIVNCELIIE